MSVAVRGLRKIYSEAQRNGKPVVALEDVEAGPTGQLEVEEEVSGQGVSAPSREVRDDVLTIG